MKVATNLSAVFATIIFSTTMLRAADQLSGDKSSTDANWSELVTSMEKMHMAMGKVKQSGDNDVDFVRLMLPHHEAAIDMAKTELLYGKDPQMRRLAQEIITDQQLEVDLMHRWLKLRDAN